MNKWKKEFLAGFPNMTPPVPLSKMTRDDANRVLWAKVSMEADRRAEDIEDVLPGLLQQALGKRALQQARQDLKKGVRLNGEVGFMCYRAAMISCYAQAPRRVPTIELMTLQISQVLLASTDLTDVTQSQRWMRMLQTAQPYNRLPC
jgi:hypothetical protein